MIAGFVVHVFGLESSDAIDWIADIGTLLLLVGVGLVGPRPHRVHITAKSIATAETMSRQ